MKLTLVAPFADPKHLDLAAPHGTTLGALLKGVEGVTACRVNGGYVEAWRDYQPMETDAITWYLAPGVDPATYGVTTALILNALITTAISTALTLGLTYLINALFPVPARTAGRPEQIYGIGGLTNTTALGTPKWLTYGRRRVSGHIIDTRVAISPDGKSTGYGIMYFMGEGPISSISEIQINDTPLVEFPGVSAFVRLGDGNTEPIQGFEATRTVWADGRTLTEDTPIVYTTRGEDVTSATIIFGTAYLFEQQADGGESTATHTITIEYKALADISYLVHDGSPLLWSDKARAQRFRAFPIEFDHADQWLIRVTLTDTTNEQNTPPSLYNVQEGSQTGSLYPTSAILALTGIASSQIQSFEAMRASALVEGLIVKTYDGAEYEEVWSDNRAWVLRHLLTDGRIGLGHRIDEALIDDDSFLAAATYWEETIGGVRRDQCNVVLNDRQPASDWIRLILQEGRAILIPSGGRLSLRVDRPGTPGLLYASPGNVVAGSLKVTAGDGHGGRQNTLRVEYPDSDNLDRPDIIEYVTPDIGAEPVRETLLALRTVTHREQVFWLARYELSRSRQQDRRYQWQSPLGAIVSEPFDTVWLTYETTQDLRGITGFCPLGSTTSRVVLDREVRLESGETYVLYLRHNATNVVEQRTITTAAGTWGALTLSTPLAVAPAESDIWAAGIQSTAVQPVVIESVKEAEGGTYILTAAPYLAAIHETPAPPAPPDNTGTNRFHDRPLPLWHATIEELSIEAEDGGIRTIIRATCTPQLASHAGTIQGADSTHIQLDLYEPARDTETYWLSELADYYAGVTIEIIEGVGAGQSREITAYDQDTRIATVSPSWTTTPAADGQYRITWPPAEETVGFVLEQGRAFGVGAGQTLIEEYVERDNIRGFTYDFTPDTTYFSNPILYKTVFRFTSVSTTGARTLRPRWAIAVVIAGAQGTIGSTGDGAESDGGGEGS